MKLILDKNSKMLGCDISKYQGKVDFFKMKKTGVRFVIIRAGYGTTEDPRFKAYIDGAKKAGLYIGVYWFIYARTVRNCIENAKKCLELVSSYNKEDFVIGVWADWEYDSDEYYGDITPTTRNNLVKVFLEQISTNGYFTGIYSNEDYIKAGKFSKELISSYPLWFAWYKSNLSKYAYTGKDEHPYIWQYTNSGNGIAYGVSTSNLDMDYGFFQIVDDDTPNVKGVTVRQFKPRKGMKADWVVIISNLKRALNSTFGLNFTENAVIDDILLANLTNVTLGINNPLTDMNYVLQQLFVWWGYDLAIDGVFGKKTEDTVYIFQTQTFIPTTKTTTIEFWKKILGK